MPQAAGLLEALAARLNKRYGSVAWAVVLVQHDAGDTTSYSATHNMLRVAKGGEAWMTCTAWNVFRDRLFHEVTTRVGSLAHLALPALDDAWTTTRRADAASG